MQVLKPIKPTTRVPAVVRYTVALPSGARFTMLGPGTAHNAATNPEVYRVVRQSKRGTE